MVPRARRRFVSMVSGGALLLLGLGDGVVGDLGGGKKG